VLTTPNKLNPDDIDRIFEHILLEHSGLNKAYNPLILDSDVKPAFTQIDPEKSQMNETLAYVRQEIAGYFGLPLHLVGAAGDSGNVWGKGIQEINYSYSDFTVSGYRSPYEEAFTSIIPRGQFAAVNARAILRANSLDNSKASLANRTGASTTPNEERRFLDLPPSVEPGADSIHTALNSNVPPPPDNTAEDTEAGDGSQEAA
jgi:phage portal protein BeeE